MPYGKGYGMKMMSKKSSMKMRGMGMSMGSMSKKKGGDMMIKPADGPGAKKTMVRKMR